MPPATPPPPPTIRTPDTPKFGFEDPWEPYQPRKSARISSQKSLAPRTPSPGSPSKKKVRQPRFQVTRASNKQPRSVANAMASPEPSPMKQRQPAKSSGAAVGYLTSEGTSKAAAFLGPPGGSGSGKSDPSEVGMLPTPVKTPSRKSAEQNEANIMSFSRRLFHSTADVDVRADEATTDAARKREADEMFNPKHKKPKKYSGNSMASFTVEEVDAPIAIYTDSHDRVPEMDHSDDNPFVDNRSRPSRVRLNSKNWFVEIPGEGRISVADATKRKDGFVYTFRGKHIWRSKTEVIRTEVTRAANDSPGVSESEFASRRSRSSSPVRPRLLFPKKSTRSQPEIDDEEADTDIEDRHVLSDSHSEAHPFTPHDQVEDKAPATPDAPRFAPASPPPTTTRATRSQKLPLDRDPSAGKSVSPFDGWRRVKPASEPESTSDSQKRASDDDDAALPPVSAKRSRK